MEKADKVRLLAYGSLKEGFYNFDRMRDYFGNDALVKIKEQNVGGFDMYSLGGYPGIVPGKGTISCDLLEVSPKAAQSIQSMELGAGYEERIIDGARIYIYRGSTANRIQIEDGNWTQESTVRQF